MNYFETNIIDCIDFNKLEIDEILDNRENDPFDEMWMTNFKAVEALKKTSVFYDKSDEKIAKIRESVFKLVFSKTNSSDLAGYISDDFGLINDALAVGYESEWLISLSECYKNGKIPC